VYLLEFGGEDDAFAAREAGSAATGGVEGIAPGLAVAHTVVPERVRGLAYTHRASDLLGRGDADLESARARSSRPPRSTGGIGRGTRDGRPRLERREHRNGGTRTRPNPLVDRGFSVDLEDPDHLLRVAFSEGTLEADGDDGVLEPLESDGTGDADGERVSVCALGWLAAESVRDFGTRAPTDKPFFQPGSMDPLLARAVANVAGARPGATILDPMCGTGGRARGGGPRRRGRDRYRRAGEDGRGRADKFGALPRARRALADRRVAGSWHVGRGDATRLPLADDAVDGVVFDAPYGRQSKIETHRLADLVAGALEEARRVAPRERSWSPIDRGPTRRGRPVGNSSLRSSAGSTGR